MEIKFQDFTSYITVKKALSPNSVRCCVQRFKIINRWLKENNLPLNNSTVERFFYELRQRGMKNNSLNTYVFTFRYIQDCYKDRGIINNFFDGFKSFEKERPLINILTPEEIESIIDARLEFGKYRKFSAEYATFFLNRVHGALTMFLAYTGCRYEEAASLKMKNIDLPAGKATFIETKNKEYRFAYIPNQLTEVLQEMCREKGLEDYVFVSLSGYKIRPQEFIMYLKMKAKVAGVVKRVHPHLFRHSFATQLIMSGIDVSMVASILGHKDIQTTYKNYVHLADKTLRNAAFRHPLLRKSINPIEIIKQVKDSLSSFRFEEDTRFNYHIEEGQNSLSFTVFLK